MNWNMKSFFEEDCTAELFAEKTPPPFIGFLQFLLRNQENYSLLLKVTRKKGDNKINELTFTFQGMEKQTITMKDLYLMGYQSWMEDPLRFLHSLDCHEPFQIAKALYREAEKKWERDNNALTGLLEMGNFKNNEIYNLFKENSIRHRRTMDRQLAKGALFPDRMKEIYADYLNELENPPEKPEHTEKPIHDHIEVELLTILSDEKVTQEVKTEAGITLNRYREKKEAEKTPEENQKNSNALIAIKTIQEHYLN